jgi:hypothetical protein
LRILVGLSIGALNPRQEGKIVDRRAVGTTEVLRNPNASVKVTRPM